jgi:class 3 adenylate cyclase/methylphosphotriester-DNA--protein-cysteine methyltransferase
MTGVDNNTKAIELEEQEEIIETDDSSQDLEQQTSRNQSDKRTMSSLGPDLSSVSLGSQSSKFDVDDSSELDEMLQQQHLRNGCFGAVERLPLFIKLFLMLVLALAAVLTLGIYILVTLAKDVKESKRTRNMSIFAVATGSLLHNIQREKSYSFIHLISNGTKFEKEYRDGISATESALHNFYRKVKLDLIDETEQEKMEDLKEVLSQMDTIRSRTSTYTVGAEELFDYYENCTNALRMFMGDFTDDAADAKLVGTLNLIMKLKESAAVTRDIVSMAILSGIDAEFYDDFITSFKAELLLEEILRFMATEEVMEQYDELVVPLSPGVFDIVQQVYKDPNNVSRLISFDDWWNMTTTRVDTFLTISESIYDEIEDDTTRDRRGTTTSIVILIIVIVALLLGSIVSAAIFSQAITGPWKRIIKVQESIVKKFLPKHLLRTLRCYRISDITLGKCIEREMTILFADIRNWTAMSEKMNPHQIFSNLNRYYAAIGPVIRKNNGYIDKFRGDQVMACFPNTQSGLKSALEIQEVIAKLNREATANEPYLTVGVGVDTGKVSCGIIGEHERMEGTIVSSTVISAARLESLTKSFKAKVITTHDAMKRLRATSEFPYRPLGYVKVKAGKQRKIKIYELVDRSDAKKMETLNEFKTAVTAMVEHKYQQAIDTLKSILERNPEDVAAERVLQSCVTHSNLAKEQRKGLTLHQALANVTLRNAFEQFSKDERSEENFQFWLSTEEYKHTTDDIKRVILIKRIFSNFLSLDSKFKVNTRDEYVKNVKSAIQQYDESLIYPSVELLNQLQADVELLMGDTFSRFKKNSDQFKTAFKKTLPVPIIHIMDEHTL